MERAFCRVACAGRGEMHLLIISRTAGLSNGPAQLFGGQARERHCIYASDHLILPRSRYHEAQHQFFMKSLPPISRRHFIATTAVTLAAPNVLTAQKAVTLAAP